MDVDVTIKITRGVRGDNWSEGRLRCRWPESSAWDVSQAGTGVPCPYNRATWQVVRATVQRTRDFFKVICCGEVFDINGWRRGCRPWRRNRWRLPRLTAK